MPKALPTDTSEQENASQHGRALGRERERQLDEWVQLAVRYFVLSNAGAAVAVVSFIGNTEAGFSRIAILALVCFIVGVSLAGLVIFAELVGAYRAFLFSTEPDPTRAVEATIQRSWLMRWIEKVPWRLNFLAGAFGLFVLGGLIGVGSLLMSPAIGGVETSLTCELGQVETRITRQIADVRSEVGEIRGRLSALGPAGTRDAGVREGQARPAPPR